MKTTPIERQYSGVIQLEMLRRGMKVTIPVAVVFALIDMAMGMPALGVVEGVAAVLMGALLVATIKLPERVAVIAHLVLLCTFLIFLAVLITGGLTDQGFIWSPGFPFVACFLVGARRGALWSAVYAVIMAAVMLFDWQAFGVHQYTLSEAGYITTAYTVFAFLAYFMNAAQQRSMGENLRLHAAIDQVSDPVYINDQSGRMIFANAAYASNYGSLSLNATGDISSLRRNGVSGEATEELDDSIRRGIAWTGELEVETLNGMRRIRRVVSPIRGVDQHCSVNIDHDITDESERKERQEHAQRLHGLGVLAGGIAHDFNNILTAIMGNAALASIKVPESAPARKFLANIELSSQRAAELCQQMLAYAGKGRFVISEVDLSQLVREMGTLMEVSMHKHVRLSYNLSEQLPAVNVDAAQIQQVVLNLITNANEAIGNAHGEVVLSSGVMDADSAYLESSLSDEKLQEGHYAYIEVVDNGCGMDAKTINKVFEPFFTTKFTGRGLGMSAVLGIVRSHQGALIVQSEPGQGSSFRVLLPVSDSIAVKSKDVGGSIDGVMHGTVLLVDDEPNILEITAIMLAELGLDTLTAHDGLQALEMYRKHLQEIDLVVLDMTMPKMGGAECYRELKRINPDVSVVIASGYDEGETTSQFSGDSLVVFIQKPYSMKTLTETMQAALVV